MERIVDNKTDVVVNHRVGCLVFFLVICLALVAGAVFYMIVGYGTDEKTNGIWLRRYVLSPGLMILGLLGFWGICKRFVKERIKGIPALIITQKSLIVSRKGDEYNEIPFSAVKGFRRVRVRSGRNSRSTYINIKYNDSAYEGSPRFELIQDIDCSGLNMRSDKLEALLQERLRNYNGQ